MMAALKRRWAGRLLQAVQTLSGLEKEPGLRDHMAFHLHALQPVHTDEQKATINGVFDAFAPCTRLTTNGLPMATVS